MSVCLCVCVCLCSHFFLGHFETDWDILLNKVAFCSWEGSKATLFKIKKQSYYPFSIIL